MFIINALILKNIKLGISKSSLPAVQKINMDSSLFHSHSSFSIRQRSSINFASHLFPTIRISLSYVSFQNDWILMIDQQTCMSFPFWFCFLNLAPTVFPARQTFAGNNDVHLNCQSLFFSFELLIFDFVDNQSVEDIVHRFLLFLPEMKADPDGGVPAQHEQHWSFRFSVNGCCPFFLFFLGHPVFPFLKRGLSTKMSTKPKTLF